MSEEDNSQKVRIKWHNITMNLALLWKFAYVPSAMHTPTATHYKTKRKITYRYR